MNANNKKVNMQNILLNSVRKDKISVKIFLMNGKPVEGVISSFDDFSILLIDDNKKQQLIYKHAISTIIPVKPVIFSKQV